MPLSKNFSGRRQKTLRSLQVRQAGDKLAVHGEIDVDAVVMVVVGSMAGGP